MCLCVFCISHSHFSLFTPISSLLFGVSHYSSVFLSVYHSLFYSVSLTCLSASPLSPILCLSHICLRSPFSISPSLSLPPPLSSLFSSLLSPLSSLLSSL